MRAILIAGTHSWQPDRAGLRDQQPDWFESGSAFARFLEQKTNIRPIFGQSPAESFTWSTDLGGVGFGRGDLRVWMAAGANLFQYAVPSLCPDARIPSNDLTLIAHSHGLQVALFALAFGLKCDTLISVGSPIRKDMMETAKLARSNVRWWIHVHSDGSDRWQWFGELFDGRLGIIREHPFANRNDFVPKVGHSELLRDAQHFHYWIEKGWV